ncbi:unnamed protein product [Adineta steineri]|uniref:EF-hand domain-containing protein n=1 Tax=Adineta steineri TaxID=433720 RepID=A0A819Q1D3_9BILA|nr:unnamed protein product [Adineta steineri]CAF1266130.1 unnamed protein product [Adineta steineri]CAF4027323.1 unnamed protein product [Adineta steineri]
MDESLTKSQKYLFMEREFIKTKEKEKIMKTKMSYDILKKFFGDKSNNRLYQLVNEADKDGTDNVELEDFMKIVDDLLNQEKDDDDDDFLLKRKIKAKVRCHFFLTSVSQLKNTADNRQ